MFLDIFMNLLAIVGSVLLIGFITILGAFIFGFCYVIISSAKSIFKKNTEDNNNGSST